MDFRRPIGNACKPRLRGVGLLLVKTTGGLSAIKDAICCWAIFIPGQDRPLNCARLRPGLVIYWDTIQNLESYLDA